MKIKQNKVDNLMSTIDVDVVSADYVDKVDKVLKDYRKTLALPGFRKGKTPMGIINKKYRASVVAEEVSKLIQDNLYEYIKSNKLRILGSPMPLEEKEIDWENSDKFKFTYEIGLAPDFDINITQKDKLNYYNITVNDALIKKYCDDIAKRNGKMNSVNTSVEGDLLFCNIQQLDSEGVIILDGINSDATVSMEYMSNEKIKKIFVGVKVGAKFSLDVKKAFSNHHDLSAMLNISKDKLNSLTVSEFMFEVKSISRLVPAKLDLDLFNKVYGEGKVNNIKQFKDKIKEEAESQFLVESDRMLKNDVVKYLLNKLSLDMPDEFLKRWLIKTSEQPITMELLDSQYELYAKSLQWQLIENKILENHKIKVTQEDVLSYTKNLVVNQMKQYGQSAPKEDQLIEIAKNILKNDEENKKIYDQIFDQRTLSVYKEKFKLKKKSISYDDFVKLAQEK